jgi:hypothetical protein
MNFNPFYNERLLVLAGILTEDYKSSKQRFISQNFDEKTVDDYIEKFKDIVQKYPDLLSKINISVPINQRKSIDSYKDFRELEQLVDYVKGQKDLEGTALGSTLEIDGKPIFKNNKVEIFYADSPRACIKYKGNIPYSWCVSRGDSSNMFYGYRYTDLEPAFYFVKIIDRTNKEFGLWNLVKVGFSGNFNDKYHFFVIQVIKGAEIGNNTNKQYVVTSADNDGDKSMSWNDIIGIAPELNGLEKVFIHKPISDEDRKYYERFKRGISDEEFSKLTYGEKSRYLDIAPYNRVKITDKQFELLPDDLKNKVIGMGISLSEGQYELIKANNKLIKRYKQVVDSKLEAAIKGTINIGNLYLTPIELDICDKEKLFKSGYELKYDQLELLPQELRDAWGKMWIEKSSYIDSEQLKLLSQGVIDAWGEKMIKNGEDIHYHPLELLSQGVRDAWGKIQIEKFKKLNYFDFKKSNHFNLELFSQEIRDEWGKIMIKNGEKIYAEQLKLLSQEIRDEWGKNMFQKGKYVDDNQFGLLSQGVRDAWAERQIGFSSWLSRHIGIEKLKLISKNLVIKTFEMNGNKYSEELELLPQEIRNLWGKIKIKNGENINYNELKLLPQKLRDVWGKMWIKNNYYVGLNSEQFKLLSQGVRDAWGEMWIKKGKKIYPDELKLLSQGVRDKYLNK